MSRRPRSAGLEAQALQHGEFVTVTTATESATGRGIGWIIAATSFSFVVTQLDVTIVNVALPRIATDLAVQVAGLQWVVDAYTLPFAVLMLSAGVLGDRFGSRRAYLVGLIIFAAASLGCGLAPDVATLIAARAVQGTGGALLIPSSRCSITLPPAITPCALAPSAFGQPRGALRLRQGLRSAGLWWRRSAGAAFF
jgi:MFS family permease